MKKTIIRIVAVAMLALMVLTAMAVARVTATAFFCLRSLIK